MNLVTKQKIENPIFSVSNSWVDLDLDYYFRVDKLEVGKVVCMVR